MRGKHGIRVFMLSPHQKMSPFQTAQMFLLQDVNIINIAVRGVFDDCQDIVKAVSNDLAFKSRYNIGTVNSINWARVVAQVVYYFKAYFAATQSNDEQVSFAVPSGNFGNICAGHIVRCMGLPIRKLILATNENDVLDEFFRTGVYRVRPSDRVQQAARRWISQRPRTSSALCSTWSAVTAKRLPVCGVSSTATASSTCRTRRIFRASPISALSPDQAATPTAWKPYARFTANSIR